MANQERNTEATDDAIMSSSSDYNLYLPMDIIVDILHCLPVKSLLRFRCVCKTFRHLISNPTFISSHLLHHRTTTATIFTFKHRTTTSLSLLQSPSSSQNPSNLVHPFPNHTRDLHLIGSINGLLCLSLSLSRTIHSIASDASSSSGTPLPNSSNLSPLPPSKFLLGFSFSTATLTTLSASDSNSILLRPATTRSSG
ncbi:hypothetical protein HYC85_010672 [Camellia sinensis]|uniref:F-box domain-containing protein n=1 Tax=Camellia sinensis TaxID=4442 RepID=A0A7J7HL58_CAMSI|nr:hypothetical protein HYC85_010672 [Camellia sinensis]